MDMSENNMGETTFTITAINDAQMVRFMLISLVVGVIIGIIIGALGMNSTWKKTAIEHKAGQYVIFNKVNGGTEFKWNDEIKGEK